MNKLLIAFHCRECKRRFPYHCLFILYLPSIVRFVPRWITAVRNKNPFTARIIHKDKNCRLSLFELYQRALHNTIYTPPRRAIASIIQIHQTQSNSTKHLKTTIKYINTLFKTSCISLLPSFSPFSPAQLWLSLRRPQSFQTQLLPSPSAGAQRAGLALSRTRVAPANPPQARPLSRMSASNGVLLAKHHTLASTSAPCSSTCTR